MRASQQLVEDLVRHYVYQSPTGAADWGGIQLALQDYGYTPSQVYEILNDVRQGGTGIVQFLTEA
jgi:hypothetical protein